MEAALPDSNTAVLRVLTTEPRQPDNLVVLDNTIECSDTYTCICLQCQLDRARLVKRGVRTSQPIPVKRRAA